MCLSIPQVHDNESRYLVMTADEKTWKFDCPVIFLGEWCRLYSRRHVWENMDAIVASPYGLESSQKDADHAESRSLEQKIFPALCKILNHYHGKKYSQRFWKIVLGHWFKRCINVIINRTKTLENCLQNYAISGISIYDKSYYALSTKDSISAVYAFRDDHWNSVLSAHILEFLDVKEISVDIIESSNVEKCFHFKQKKGQNLSPIKKYALFFYKIMSEITGRYLIRASDAFIINTYLPKKEEIKLQLALGQFPQLWVSPRITVSATANRQIREQLASRLITNPASKTENILQTLLFQLLPVCYLEGFGELDRLTEKQAWPEKPKFIFTSNNFDMDEIFKLWAAKKVESGISYIIGQHGNNYGTYRYMEPSVEEESADKFLTWGWTDGLLQHTPSFIFKTAGRKEVCFDSKGGLLFIQLCLDHRLTTWDNTVEFFNYFKNQQCFVKNLIQHIKRKTTIRLHAEHRNMSWDEEARWNAFDSSLKIDTGDANIRCLLSQNRLVVHSYDSTGILETLSQNIPTLAFWQNEFDHLRESAKPYYQLLVDAGIVHLSPESAAQKVNQIWDDVDGWWMQDEVQNAKNKFCERYARTTQSPVSDLKKILLN